MNRRARRDYPLSVGDVQAIDAILTPMNDPQNTTPEIPSRALEWLPAWELIALFLGDFITLILFGLWGQASHDLLSTSGSPLRAAVNTATPFMIAWLIVGFVIGTYKATALYPLPRAIWKTALAGLLAGPLGGVFWALLRNHWPVPIFYVVTTATSAAVLMVWRVLWSRLRRLWWPELP
jgi:hypothetical protein